ncbi:MAG: uncharacterized protein QOE37_2082 [Microbacteriaceae bacterium]|nr:uncharacterized protein [Microbacteriaceae bacterium]
MAPRPAPRQTRAVTGTFRALAWRGLDDPRRFDSAVVRSHTRRLSATGASSAPGYATAWVLETAADWVTETLRVRTVGPGWGRTLELSRSPEGAWACTSTSWGSCDLPDPGLADPSILDGAADCDLGLCPFTNTMPILRSGVLSGAASADLVIALVDVPSLAVLRSEQRYSAAPHTASGPRTVRFESGDFSADLVVDDAGFVLRYPGLAERVPAPAWVEA